jgi:iron complex outermembrane receptor protein
MQYLKDNNNMEKIENIYNLIYTTKQQPYVEQMGSSVMWFGNQSNWSMLKMKWNLSSPMVAPVVITLTLCTLFDMSDAASSTFSDTSNTAASDYLDDLSLDELFNLKISPFDVSTQFDTGYYASNSVSSSRFDSPIRNLPFAIQAFTESFINDQKPRDIFDIARYSPGVTYRSNDFNEGNANLAIRGFAVSSIAGGNIAIMRDGFHGPTIFDFTNISRLEVVKGPSSFIYGQVAPGGIVNVITKSPQPKFAITADARYGSYGEYRFDADVTGPAAKSLYFRVASSFDHDIEYWKPYDAHSVDISPSLLWQPSNRISMSLKYEHYGKNETPQIMQKPGYNTQRGILPTPSDPNLSGVDVPGLADDWNSMSFADFRDSKTNGLSYWIDFKANEHWGLRLGYSHQDNEIDALFSGNLGMANNTTFLQGRRLRQQTYTNWDNTGELESIGKYNLPFVSLSILLGAQYVNRRLERTAGQAPNDTSLGNNPTASPLPLWNLNDPSTWNRNVTIPLNTLTESQFNETDKYIDKSIYGSATFGFFDERLLMLLGLRHTATHCNLTNNLNKQTIFNGITNAFTPQFGALFKFIPGISLFGSYSESFVPGTSLLTNPDGTTSPSAPTKGQGADIGCKSDILNGRVSGTITFFNINNKNIINDLATTDTFGRVKINYVQSGVQRSRGIEIDATIRATNDWQIYASYSHMDARIIEFSGNDDAVLARDTSKFNAADRANYKNIARFHDAPLQMSAPDLANIWTRYNFTQTILKGIYIAGGFNFVYDQTLLPDCPKSYHQTYTLGNAMVGYSLKLKKLQIDMDFSGKNLANEHYRPSQSTRGRPRELILTLTCKF